jgi:single-strand DNA-binding protein
MASYNRVILVGNLTRAPEVQYTPSGTAVCDVRLAMNDRVKKGEEYVDEPTFVDVTLWARTAEIASQYLEKGSSILVEGRLKLASWEKDGEKRSKLKVECWRMQMLPRGGANADVEAGTDNPLPTQEPQDAPF